jgi:hypothetical protein
VQDFFLKVSPRCSRNRNTDEAATFTLALARRAWISSKVRSGCPPVSD